MTLGIFVPLPLSMLLILSGALCAGAFTAAWFTVSQRQSRQVHRIQVIIETDAEPELIEKTS
ncbi:MAG: hypothetical protein ACM3SW_16635 [Actinomycetota bacterium]